MTARALLLIALVPKALATYDQTPQLHAGESSPDDVAEAATCQLLQMGSGLRQKPSEASEATLPKPLCNPEMKKAQESWAAVAKEALSSEGKGIAAFLDLFTCQSNLGLPAMTRWSSMMLTAAAGFGQPAYKDRMLSTADGVYPVDAAWCSVNGFLSLPGKGAILSNASAIVAMASQLCAAYGVYNTTMNMYELALVPDGPDAVREQYRIEAQKPASERVPPMARAVNDRFNRLFCAAGMMPCGMHFCMQDFCTLADGVIGMGCQCNVTYMVPPPSP